MQHKLTYQLSTMLKRYHAATSTKPITIAFATGATIIFTNFIRHFIGFKLQKHRYYSAV